MDETPHLRQISIKGFRGFADEQTLHFAVPSGVPGSGLTILVGPNNAGKSSIVESLTAIKQRGGQEPTFSEGKRNALTDNRVTISLTDNGGNTRTITTVASGGSEAQFSGPETAPSGEQIFVLPSRRTFQPFFAKSEATRDQYTLHRQQLQNTRTGQSELSQRIFHINNNPEKREEFENILSKVLNPVPDWTIEQTDQGNYYLRYTRGQHTHTSDGLGDGILSIFFIVDALYDSEPGTAIIIDEPELSLHPQLQKKVRDLIVEYSQDRQIIISTHAPKFMDWHAIAAGAHIARVNLGDQGILINELTDESRSKVSRFLSDMNNPHVLGLDANEVFFLADKIVLVEGQEDVMYFPKVLSNLGTSIAGEFYGWGVGGADKMATVCSILQDLGFQKVAGVLDQNKSETADALRAKFPSYQFVVQPADDVRFKEGRGVTSLLAEDNETVRNEFRSDAVAMFEEINAFLKA